MQAIIANNVILIIFLIKRPTSCTNFANLFWHGTLHVFGRFLCPSSGVHSLYTQQWYMSYRFVDSLRAGSGSLILILLVSCLKICMTYTIAECTVNELLVMDRGSPKHVEFQTKNKFAKLVHLFGLIIKKFVTMHGHMNVKKTHTDKIGCN